jgi:hypothetical protein
MLGKLAKGMKDGALGLALKSFLNEKLSKYGEVQDCQIDTGANKIKLRALLRGEKDPINAAIDKYELERIGDDSYIKLIQLSCSREWLSLLLNQLIAGKQYKLPKAVSNFL